MQVQVVDQTSHPPKCHIFVESAPVPLLNTNHFTIQKNPCDYKGHTHTRLPEGRRRAKVKANVHVCARKRQKNEDMTGGRDGTKVRVVVMKGEPSAQGHPMKLTSL